MFSTCVKILMRKDAQKNSYYEEIQSATQNYKVKYTKLLSVLHICVVLLQRNYIMQHSLFLQSTVQYVFHCMQVLLILCDILIRGKANSPKF